MSRPARLHAMDQLPAGQPLLAVPVDRGRLAARVVGAACRRDRLACPSPRGLQRAAVESPLSLPPARRANYLRSTQPAGADLARPDLLVANRDAPALLGAMRMLMPGAGRQP